MRGLGGLTRGKPTEPAGNPSFLGRPTGLFAFVGGDSLALIDFLVLPFGRPGFRFGGISGIVAGFAIACATDVSGEGSC